MLNLNNRLRPGFALLVLACSVPALAQVKPQVINVELSRPGEPIRLDIDILSARIEVIGENRKDASFEVSINPGQQKIITPSGARTLKTSAYSFDVDEDDNEITLSTDWRSRKANVVVRIPRRADVELNTVNNGELIVRNVTGNVELYNTNGPITATNISGSIIAESVNATIDVSYSKLDDVNASAFESINGDIYLRLPARTGANIHLDTAMGEILSDFEVDVVPSEGIVKREEHSKGVSVRIENVIVARINGGGPVVRVKTLHGDIHILKAE